MCADVSVVRWVPGVELRRSMSEFGKQLLSLLLSTPRTHTFTGQTQICESWEVPPYKSYCPSLVCPRPRFCFHWKVTRRVFLRYRKPLFQGLWNLDLRILIGIAALIIITVLDIVLLWFCGGLENPFLPSCVLNGIKEMTAVLEELAFCVRKQNEAQLRCHY